MSDRLTVEIPEVEIDPETVALFESMPDATIRPTWTKEKEALLVKYWPIKKHAEVAKALDVSTNTALKKFRELTG